MLDIIIIFLFAKRIGLWAEKKGYNRGLFRGLFTGAWFTGEVIGLIVGIFIFAESFNEDTIYMLLLPALLGAGAGIMIMVFIIMALPSRVQPATVVAAPVQAPVEVEPERAPIIPWTCPACGYHNTYRYDRCFNCKKPNPVTT